MLWGVNELTLKQFVLDYLESEFKKTDRIVSFVREDGDSDMQVQLGGGKHVAIYVINRAIRVPEINELLERNTHKHLYTLFLLDGRMVPKDGTQVDPPAWMAMLHTLAHHRLYAYWCDLRNVTIRPIHLGWRWGEHQRGVVYGSPVNVNNLRAEMIVFTSEFITGRIAAADFGDDTFWKRVSPMQESEQRYSWRQWSFGGSRKRQPSEETEQSYGFDSWEEFERHYGDVGTGTDYRYYRNQTREERKPPRRIQSLMMRHYNLLGLTKEATLNDARLAYRKLARENHPDLHPTEKEKYTLRMAQINAAFEAIRKTFKAD